MQTSDDYNKLHRHDPQFHFRENGAAITGVLSSSQELAAGVYIGRNEMQQRM